VPTAPPQVPTAPPQAAAKPEPKKKRLVLAKAKSKGGKSKQVRQPAEESGPWYASPAEAMAAAQAKAAAAAAAEADKADDKQASEATQQSLNMEVAAATQQPSSEPKPDQAAAAAQQPSSQPDLANSEPVVGGDKKRPGRRKKAIPSVDQPPPPPEQTSKTITESQSVEEDSSAQQPSQRIDDGIYATPSAAPTAPKAKGQRGRPPVNKRLNPQVQDEIVPSNNTAAPLQAQAARPKRTATKQVNYLEDGVYYTPKPISAAGSRRRK